MFNNFSNQWICCLSIAFAGCALRAQAQESTWVAPLGEKDWVILSYNKIPPNKVTFSDGGFLVNVKSSAGPIVHKLEGAKRVIGFSIKGKLAGLKKLEAGGFDEDSVFRLGLVAAGSQTLTGPRRWFAADWVKKLFSLAPEGSGLDKIYFFNLTNRADLVGKLRTHPKSNLIVEDIFASQNQEGIFAVSKKLTAPIDTVALWISIDGDDSKSEFQTSVSEIKLTVAK